jgi:Ran GTPase-activating protein (RanGAP) involved in mRNA processing and transport
MMTDGMKRAIDAKAGQFGKGLVATPPKKAVLRTLCGLVGSEETLKLRMQGLTAGCAVLLAAELPRGMLGGCIVTLDLSGNKIGGEGLMALAAAIAGPVDAVDDDHSDGDEGEDDQAAPNGGVENQAAPKAEAGIMLPSIGSGGSWTDPLTSPGPGSNGQALVLPPTETEQASSGAWAEEASEKAAKEKQQQAATRAKAAARKRAKGKLKRMRNKMALMTEHARVQGEAARVPLLSTLILSDCNAGEYMLPLGWTIWQGSYIQKETGEFMGEPPVGTKQAGTIALMAAVATNTTLTALDLSKNEIGTKEVGVAIAAMLRRNKTLTSLELASNVQYSDDEANRDGRVISAIDPLAFVGEVAAAMSRGERGNSTLTHLGLADNRLLSVEGGRIFSEMFRRRTPPRAIRLLDVSRNGWEVGEAAKAVEMAKVAAAAEGADAEEEVHLMLMPAAQRNTSAWASSGGTNRVQEELKAKHRFAQLIAEAQPDGVQQNATGFARALATGLKQTRALTSVNTSLNGFGPDLANDFVKMAKLHQNIKSLCGSLGTERKWDFKGRCFGVEDCMMLGQDIKANKSLTELDASDNALGGEQRWMGVGAAELMTHKIGSSYGVGDSFVWDQHKVHVIAVHTAGEDGAKERTLDFEFHDLRGVIALGNAIRLCKRLRKLDMSGNRIDERGKVVIAGAMFVQERLRFVKCDEWEVSENTVKLDVSKRGLEAADVTLLAALIRNNHRLHSINLLQNHIGLEGLQTIKETLEESDWLLSVCGAAGESSLDLSGLEMDEQDGELVSIELDRNESLTSVCLLKSSINRNGLEAIQSNPRFRSVCGVAVGQKELDLSRQCLQLRDARLVSIELGKNYTLTKLDLAGNHFEEAGKAMIGTALLNSRVQFVSTDNFVLDEHTRVLDLSAMGRGALPANQDPNLPKQQDEHTRRTSMLLPGSEPMSPADGMLLFGALRSNRMVTKLIISGNECLDTGSGRVLGQALEHNYSLLRIDISKNYAHDSGGFAEGFAVGLRKNKTLTELNVAGNTLGFWGGHYLAEGIKGCPSIKKLTISGDNYYKRHWLRGGWAEAPPITLRRNIVSVDLQGKRLGPGGCMTLLGFLDKCPNLVSLNLMNNGIGTKAAEEVVKAFKQNPTLQSICGLQATFAGHRRPIELREIEDGLDPGDAVLIVGELEGNPNATSLDLTDTDVSEIYMSRIRFACITHQIDLIGYEL